MEAILLVIISSIIGYFLKNKNQEVSETPPPINQRKQQVEPKKQQRQRIGDYAKTAIQDLEKKISPIEFEKQATELVETVENLNGKIFEHAKPTEVGYTRIPKTEETKNVLEKQATTTAGFKFPSNSNELAHAIVMSEILGPPKSKR